MPEFVDDLGERIKAARKERGLSQEALAYRVGLEQTAISKIERGKDKPSTEKLRQLAQVLGLSEDALLR